LFSCFLLSSRFPLLVTRYWLPVTLAFFSLFCLNEWQEEMMQKLVIFVLLIVPNLAFVAKHSIALSANEDGREVTVNIANDFWMAEFRTTDRAQLLLTRITAFKLVKNKDTAAITVYYNLSPVKIKSVNYFYTAGGADAYSISPDANSAEGKELVRMVEDFAGRIFKRYNLKARIEQTAQKQKAEHEARMKEAARVEVAQAKARPKPTDVLRKILEEK
jgi:hypothetical protein